MYPRTYGMFAKSSARSGERQQPKRSVESTTQHQYDSCTRPLHHENSCCGKAIRSLLLPSYPMRPPVKGTFGWAWGDVGDNLTGLGCEVGDFL